MQYYIAVLSDWITLAPRSPQPPFQVMIFSITCLNLLNFQCRNYKEIICCTVFKRFRRSHHLPNVFCAPCKKKNKNKVLPILCIGSRLAKPQIKIPKLLYLKGWAINATLTFSVLKSTDVLGQNLIWYKTLH